MSTPTGYSIPVPFSLPGVKGVSVSTPLGQIGVHRAEPITVKSNRGYGRNDSSLRDFLNATDVYDPGSAGGGGGGGGAAAALMAALQANRDAATARYGANKGTLKDIYDNLDESLANNPAASQQRYDTLRSQSRDAGSDIAAQTIANQQAHDEQRRIALQSLGVNPEAAVSQENAATNEGLSRLAQSNASWDNLNGVLGSAQVGRDRLDINGANDAEAIAQKELLNSYEDYMRQLDESMMGYSSSGGGGGGSAGTGPSVSNPFRDQLTQLTFQKMLDRMGLGSQQSSGNLGAYLGALGSGVNPQTNKPYSDYEVQAQIAKSSDPQGAYAAWLASKGR